MNFLAEIFHPLQIDKSSNDAAVFLSDQSLEAVEEAFAKNFELGLEIGASLVIYQAGEPVLHLAQGWCDREKSKPWTSDTLIPVYSATKGPAAATVLLLLEKHGLRPSDKVVEVWPRFPNPDANFAQLLSHQCGLAALDKYVSVFDYPAVINAIEQQSPHWELGSAHGYHARTFGFLLDEICLRLEGEKLGPLFQKHIAEPLGLEMWIGLPKSEHPRVATLYPGKANKNEPESAFYKEFNQQGTLVKKAFNSPRGLQSVQDMNTAKAWTAGLPSLGGVATADALARFYQAAIGETDHFSEDVLEWIGSPLISGLDLVLKTETTFSCGFQFDPLDSFRQKIRQHYGFSERAFGHPGAGGSHAFGDPDTGLSFGYTMNQMEMSVLPNKKVLRLVEALYG